MCVTACHQSLHCNHYKPISSLSAGGEPQVRRFETGCSGDFVLLNKAALHTCRCAPSCCPLCTCCYCFCLIWQSVNKPQKHQQPREQHHARIGTFVFIGSKKVNKINGLSSFPTSTWLAGWLAGRQACWLCVSAFCCWFFSPVVVSGCIKYFLSSETNYFIKGMSDKLLSQNLKHFDTRLNYCFRSPI